MTLSEAWPFYLSCWCQTFAIGTDQELCSVTCNGKPTVSVGQITMQGTPWFNQMRKENLHGAKPL